MIRGFLMYAGLACLLGWLLVVDPLGNLVAFLNSPEMIQRGEY